MGNRVPEKFIPTMSATAARHITATLFQRAHLNKQYFIVEYGAGYSTKFFVDRLVKENVRAAYVAVERDPRWYDEILKLFPHGELIKHPWFVGDYIKFVRSKSLNVWDVPEECRRLKGEQSQMRSPRNLFALLTRKSSFWFDARYRVALGDLNFECVYVFEGFKDQYGESPNKYKYIRTPLEPLLGALKSKKGCHTVFIIDGGPRADVVKEVFSLIDTYQNLTADIFLLEAYRGYYQSILSSRSGGYFIEAEKNERLDGSAYLKEPKTAMQVSPCARLIGEPSIAEALKRELWFYTNR